MAILWSSILHAGPGLYWLSDTRRRTEGHFSFRVRRNNVTVVISKARTREDIQVHVCGFDPDREWASLSRRNNLELQCAFCRMGSQTVVPCGVSDFACTSHCIGITRISSWGGAGPGCLYKCFVCLENCYLYFWTWERAANKIRLWGVPGSPSYACHRTRFILWTKQ